MSVPIEQAIEKTRSLDQELSAQLESDPVSFADLGETLQRIRQDFLQPILRDVRAAVSNTVDDRLWGAHRSVNERYRKRLSQLKDAGDSKKVERRKLGNEYLRFLKASQRFYRTLIYYLADNYGLPELENLVRIFKTEDRSPHHKGAGLTKSDDIRHALLLLCNKTLIQLGDLSRYRETDLISSRPPPHTETDLGTTKRSDWSHAKTYYGLAREIMPSSGMADHQMCIIDREEGNLFLATYHLYRAMSAETPHTGAEGNLKKSFYKVSQAWARGQTAQDLPLAPNLVSALYLRLVSHCYHGVPFDDHFQLEADFFAELTQSARDPETSDSLYQISITSFAAGHHAQKKFEKHSDLVENMQAYVYFLRVNLRSITCFFQVLTEEMQKQSSVIEPPSERLSPIIRKLLPIVRLYSAWILKNLAVLTAETVHPHLEGQHEQFWAAFANCFAAMIVAFPADSLKAEHDLLLEDADTIAFQPLICEATKDFWYHGDSKKSRRHDDKDSESCVRIAMLSRIRSLLMTALQLDLYSNNVPAAFSDKIRQPPSETDLAPRPSAVPIVIAKNTLPRTKNETALGAPIVAHQMPESHLSQDLGEIEAERMVSNLVDLEMDRMGPGQSTANHALSGTGCSRTPVSGSSVHEQREDSSPFPVGTHTASDLLAAVQKYSTGRRDSTSSNAQMQSPRVMARTSSSQSHSSSNAYWVQNSQTFYPQNSGTSYLAQDSGSRPGTGYAARSPRMATSSSGHLRLGSNESSGSRNSIWTTNPGTFGSGHRNNSSTSLANVATSGSPANGGTRLGSLGNGTFSGLHIWTDQTSDNELNASRFSGVGNTLLSSTGTAGRKPEAANGVHLGTESPHVARLAPSSFDSPTHGMNGNYQR